MPATEAIVGSMGDNEFKLNIMIRVQCSKLEEVRANPVAFANMLKNDKSTNGGSYGMFACWQTKIKEVHQEKLTVTGAIKALQQRFMSFADNASNRRKQDFLIDRMAPYFKNFDKQGFKLEKTMIHIRWELINDVMLTGHSPMLVSNDSFNVAYYFAESEIDWKEQLRFPLLQHYLATKYFSCQVDKLKVGIYCLRENKFSIQSYGLKAVENAIEEARSIFTTIDQEYNR